MKKLEVGMYVRTKWGIAKIREVEVVEEILGREVQLITVYYVDSCFQPIDETKCFKEDILKASYNIIELIEVGDYVNGVEVIGKEFDNFNKEYLQCGVGDYVICTFEVKDIKTILTKEQFNSMKYEVGE